MESFSSLAHGLRFAKDENRLVLDCLHSLQKMMSKFTGSAEENENLTHLADFVLVLIERMELSTPGTNDDFGQLVKASGDKQTKNFETIGNELFHLIFKFVSANNCQSHSSASQPVFRLMNSLYKIMLKCCFFTGDENRAKYFDHLLSLFSVQTEITHDKVFLTAVDYMCQYLDQSASTLSLIEQSSILQALEHSFQVFQEQILAEVFLNLIPRLLMKSPDQVHLLESLCGACFKNFSIQGDKVAEETSCSQSLFLICGLSDIFFPPGQIQETQYLLENAQLWHVLKSGLISPDVLARKRGLFLLGKLLDHAARAGPGNTGVTGHLGNAEQPGQKTTRKFWDDFILITETLEETQFHLIEPVLKRIDHLVTTVTTSSPSASSSCLLPSCDWLLIVFKRMMEHDCILVKRCGLSKLLTSINVFRGSQTLLTGFFCHHLLDSLQDSSVFHRSTNVDEKHPDSRQSEQVSEVEMSTNDVAEALNEFFRSIDLDREELKTFLLSLLVGITSRSWSGPILCSLLKSIDFVGQEHFLGVAEILPILRTMFSKTIASFDSKIKAIARHYLAILVAHFVDPDSVNPNDLLSLVSVIPSDAKFLELKNMVEWTCRCLRVERSEFESNLNCMLKRRLEKLLKSPCLSLDGRYSLDEFTSEQECSTIVRAILLVDKALELKFIDHELSPIRNKLKTAILQPLEDVLKQLIGHAYLSEDKVHWVFMMLLTFQSTSSRLVSKHFSPQGTVSSFASKFCYELLHRYHCKEGSLLKSIYDLTESFLESIVVFTSRKFAQKMRSYSAARLYLEMIGACSCLHDKGGFQTLHSLSSFKQLFDWSIENLRQMRSTNKGKVSATQLVSLELLTMAVETLPQSTHPSSPSYIEPLLHLLTSEWILGVRALDKFEASFVDPKKLHVVRDHMMESQLALAGWLLATKTSSSSHLLSSLSLVDQISEFVESCAECGSIDTCNKCCQVLRLLLREVDQSRAGELIALTWKKIAELSKKRHFPDCFRSFVSSVFQLELMDVNDSDPFDEGQQLLLSTIVGIASEILARSEERPQLLSIIIRTICEQLSANKDLVVRLVPLIPFISRALVFGPLQDRASRFRDDLIKNYEHDWPEYESNFITEDQSARMTLLQFLLTLRPISHEQSLFGFSLLDELLLNYRNNITRSLCCYGNSMLHRCKHRMMVAMFAMEKFLMVKKGQVIKFLLEVPSVENQPSVRFLASWMLIRIIGDMESKYFQSLVRLVEESDGDKMKKPSMVTSMFHVISHVVARSIRTCGMTQQPPTIQKYLDVLLTWSTMPQSSTRISSQAAILFLAECIRSGDRKNGEGKKDHHSLLNLSNFLTKNRSTYRHAFQLLDSLYYKFDPFLDATMEAIAHFVPLLTGLSSDECLEVQHFDPNVEGSIPVLLSDERRSVWEKCLLPGNLWKDSSASNNTNNNNNSNSNTANPITGDSPILSELSNINLSDNVQKKIIPWRDLLFSAGRMGESSGCLSAIEGEGGLILVASLVDRIPNLGGLCRTCEIFGVSKMVVNSSKVISDVNFEKLSVTAHKWVNIEEVPVRGLPSYLSGLTREGYTIVALEQTSKSIPLQEYKFPSKCAVVLGNERSGIPVEVIQLMGVCLEIPQHGVIRSLNVHVSGALLMWEYFKQTKLEKMMNY